MKLKPFFQYYGGKYRIADSYPAPTFETIVEPFAGAAGYATKHHTRKVVLFEINPRIATLWKYLIQVTPGEVRRIPLQISHVDQLSVEEQRILVGFWLNTGTTHPCKIPSASMRSERRVKSFWGEAIRERIASQVDAIKHWQIKEQSFSDALDICATWFIDPPYQGAAGRRYQFSKIEYVELANFCLSRKGQVIVCESTGADWLPFQFHRRINNSVTSRGKTPSTEMVWRNEPEFF